jgi:hypothetical protein
VKKKGMEEKEKPHIPETTLESWAPKWLKKFAEENGLSLAELFNFEEGRFLRKREIENLKVALPQLRKPEALIDKYDFQTIQDVEKLIMDFAETHKDLLSYTPKALVVEEGEHLDYIMACRASRDGSVNMLINKEYENALISALQKLKNKDPLTKADEVMLETLWHEFIHLRTKNLFKVIWDLCDDHRRLTEMLTELVARHTYDRFLNMLRPGTKLNYQKEIIEVNVGYQGFIERFRYLLRKFEINEEEAVKELEYVLIEGVQDDITRWLADWLGKKVELLEVIERYNILDDLVKLEKVSYKEFKKEVDRLYEVVKRRQQQRNPG